LSISLAKILNLVLRLSEKDSESGSPANAQCLISGPSGPGPLGPGPLGPPVKNSENLFFNAE